MLCFLHIVLGVQQLCRHISGVFKTVTDKLWHLYASENRRQFAQRLRRLVEWAKRPEHDLAEKARQKLMNLPNKAPQLKVTFALPDAYRTSNQVDRLMNYQDRILYAALLILAMKLRGGGALSAPPPLNFIAGLSNVDGIYRKMCQSISHG